MSLLDINFANKCYEQWRWHPGAEGPGYHEFIRRGNVRWINVNMESQANDARQRAHEVRSQTRIRVRHMLHTPPGSSKKTDDGMWQQPPLEWVHNVVIAHNYHNTGWYILDSNEFSTENEDTLNEYIDTRIQVIDEVVRLRKTGVDIRLALLSTPSHWPAFSENPKVAKWLDNGKLDRLFTKIADHQGPASDPLIGIFPNAYYNELNDDGCRNIVAIWERFKRATNKTPHLIVGEFAYARPLDSNGRVDAHGGYLAINMPPKDMITGMVGRIQRFFLARGIRLMAYCEGYIGGNEVLTFNFGQKTLGELMDAAMNLEPPKPINEPPALPGKDSDVWDDAQLLVDQCRVRSAPFTTANEFRQPGKILVTLGVGTNLKVWQEPNYVEDGYRWFGVMHGEYIGWMALVRPDFGAQFKLLPTGPDPDVPGDPDPPPDDEDTVELPPLEDLITHEQAQALIDERIGAFRAQIMADVAAYLETFKDTDDIATIRKIGAILSLVGSTQEKHVKSLNELENAS